MDPATPSTLASWSTNKTSEGALDAWLESIAQQTTQICCFGASNKGNSKAVGLIIRDLLNEFITLKLHLEKTNQKQTMFEILKQMSPAFNKLMTDENKYFKMALNSMCVQPAGIELFLTALKELAAKQMTITKTDPSQLKDYQEADFQGIIANFTFDWITKIKSRDIYYPISDKEKIQWGEHYMLKEQKEPTDPLHRALVIQYMMRDIKGCCINFGHGNCALMAELAFLLAVLQLPTTPIRLLKFTDKNGKIEELNAIVIGNWPEAGCRVLAPWLQQKPFEWKGSFQNTPELNDLNTAHVLFTVEDKKSQETCKEIIQSDGFDVETLLKSNNRKNMTDYIKTQSLKISKINQMQQQLSVSQKK